MKVDTSEATIERMADSIEPKWDFKGRGFCPGCEEYRYEELGEVAKALRALREERDAALTNAARLREALSPFARAADYGSKMSDDVIRKLTIATESLTWRNFKAAHAALAGEVT